MYSISNRMIFWLSPHYCSAQQVVSYEWNLVHKLPQPLLFPIDGEFDNKKCLSESFLSDRHCSSLSFQTTLTCRFVHPIHFVHFTHNHPFITVRAYCAVVVEAVRQLRVAAYHVGRVQDRLGYRVVDTAAFFWWFLPPEYVPVFPERGTSKS